MYEYQLASWPASTLYPPAGQRAPLEATAAAGTAGHRTVSISISKGHEHKHEA